MEYKFSPRIGNVSKSFIREILKLTQDSSIISFAGGLPNPNFFPDKELKDSCNRLFDGTKSHLQYSTTEGYEPLRENIAKNYQSKGLNIKKDEILMLNGSQQAFDLIAKILIDKGDLVVIERPGYIGAIQSFSIFEPNFIPIDLENDGINIEKLENAFKKKPKLFYTAPNFQNPSGVTYSTEKRQKIAQLAEKYDVLIIEDDPYGELRFLGKREPYIASFAKDRTILLGSYSKIIAPALRMGWVCADKKILDNLITVKQASDLHSNFFSQRLIYDYLANNDINEHIKTIIKVYGEQRQTMIDSIEKYFPKNVEYTKPEGGMFLFATLPEYISSLKLFDLAIKNKVAFVPGVPFYVPDDKFGERTMRLNFSHSTKEKIEEGIKNLGSAIKSIDNFE